MWSSEDAAIVGLSLKVAIVATIGALPFAILAALALARGRFWGEACSTPSSICRS